MMNSTPSLTEPTDVNKSEDRQYAWAYLSRVLEGPSEALQIALAERDGDVESIARDIKNRDARIGEDLLLRSQARSDAGLHHIDRDLKQAEKVGARLITPDSPEWPDGVGGAESIRGDGQHHYVPPHALWVRGQLLKPLFIQAVGIVGTRTHSRYGKEATELISGGLATHCYTVVSGGALGIDTVAHTQAIARGGRTVAVLATGIDKAYPARNTALFDRIAEHGALISEYPPGVHPARHRFLTRNRLVAGLTQGIVVVEAAWRSGALNTLAWANCLGKVAMAVPGPITSRGSVGCNVKIREHQAHMVVGADDVRSLLAPIGAVDADENYMLDFGQDQTPKLSRLQLQVFDALNAPGVEGVSTSVAARRSGLGTVLCVQGLMELKDRGLAALIGGLWVRIEHERDG